MISVLPRRGPSGFDRLTMDAPRVYAPATDSGGDIVVHSKVMIVDQRLLAIGSANLSKRSMGFDTECALVLDAEAQPPERQARVRAAIEQFSQAVLAHFRRG